MECGAGREGRERWKMEGRIKGWMHGERRGTK